MNRNYKVIWNASLNCFMAVSEYAKARGKSSKSSVSANATINTTSNLSSTNAFRLTAIGLGLGLLAAGFSIPASANNGTSNHHDGTYSHSHGSHGTHTHTNGNNSHNNPNGPGNSGSSISLNFEGDNSTTITRTNGQTLNILGGASGDLTTNNIGVFGSGDSLHIQLAENLTGLTSVTTGNSLLNTSGLAITGGPTFTKARVDVAGNKITGVASGVGNDSNAANIGDLNNAVAANKTKYYSVKNTSAAAATGPGSNVNNDGATKPNAMAMGVNASATGGQAIAIGSGDSGQNTTASGEQSIAIGANVVSSGASSIAIGGDDLDDASKVNGVNALFNTYTGSIGGLVTVGDYSDHTESGGAASVAIGVKAHSKGNLSTAVGVRSSSSGDASSAFGMGSSASQNGSVALGAGSVANRAGGFAAYTGGATGNALTAINSNIGRAELGAVSVGPGGEKGTRQIINVAAGSFDSDAVNVAQLKGGISSVIDLGFDITADNASLAPGETKDKVKLGETVKYTSADGSIVTTVADNEINFALGDNLSVGGSGQDGEDGVDGFIGVNGADGQSGIALNGANGTIGLTGPTGASGIIGVIDGVPGVNGVDGITRIVIDDIQVATMEDGMKFEGNTGDTIAKKLNQTLNIEGTLADSADASGANLRVDSDGSKLNLVMAKNLTDLDSIMINNGGPIISRTGIDMGPVDANSYPTNRITNLGKGIAGTDAVNRDQLDELTTDLTDLGLNFGGDSGDPVNLKLGQKLAVKGGDTINADPATKNISVTANDADTLTVRLAKDINLGNTGSVTTGNTQVNNAGITLYRGDNGQVVLTNNGLNNGNNKITNVADGLLSTTSKDAVNGSQLFKTNEDVAKGIKIGDGNSANINSLP
ncbi:ESPR-type extended signal peptide-containing protein [Psychrobacter maritimus]|uniref:ESPR-type extended signal peptide-containing protein n=1 Tax=Psychrobacter maritimus TaxID=256325 RepID=UPI00191B4563|nr:ESPR-type extended signal peptide-containing protein [Psychrobacter maritimus]